MALSTLATIKHRFQTTKAQRASADVSRDEWNDSELVASAAVNGEVAVRDSAQTDGWGFQALLRLFSLGGSRNNSLEMAGAVQDAYDYRDVEIDGDLMGALVARIRCELRTDDAGTTITPQIYNVTTDTILATGNVCAAIDEDFQGTEQIQNFTFILTAGVNKYRLRGTPSDGAVGTYLIGDLQIGG